MAKNEKKDLSKKNWTSSFTLIGKAKINDYTYKTDEKSKNSDWIYNSFNLGVDCGEKFGTVYAEMMGGFGSNRDNVVYVHGKTSDNKDDFENRFEIDWDDRKDTKITDTVGDLCFITVGLEKDEDGKTVYNKFLSQYDAIAYIKENLKNDTYVNVKGTLKYQIYQGETTVKKEINSIVLSQKAVDEPASCKATFVQTMLIKKDSIDKPNKEKGIVPIYGTVLDYAKEYNGKIVKCNIPITKMFELEINEEKPDITKYWLEKILKVKKDVTEITLEGDLIEGGALIETTIDDLPDDIKELIEIGAYTEQEALAKCTESADKEKRMVIRKPAVKLVGDKGSKTPVVQKFENKYKEEDLILDFMTDDNDDEEETENNSTTENTESEDLDDFLANL